jgi:inner membrane protein involved in colicin E2 resistance
VDLQPVMHSVKYAGLFVSLGLLTPLRFEHLTRRATHPIENSLLAFVSSVF